MADQFCFGNRRRLWYEGHSWPFDKKNYNSSGHVRYMAAMAKYCIFLKIFTTSIRRDFLYRNLFLLSFYDFMISHLILLCPYNSRSVCLRSC